MIGFLVSETTELNALINGNKKAYKERGSGHIATTELNALICNDRLESTNQTWPRSNLIVTVCEENKEFLVEVIILGLLHHSNLVNLIGYYADGDQRLLGYKYMTIGSLVFRSPF
ncbi:hypothetical protein POM88_020195 [Heracleum sosnowskyi]|uniref:Serine-threonine/tyrosine-protein kinase catalytic domain-containing protein n=1 Tax=Heracleum sosnowskyi TaxID=360622 RepID=A0AAD8IBG4_9APIA|nr:hypothetical protein POM88_020195 [Heracleum sosnowskyi]